MGRNTELHNSVYPYYTFIEIYILNRWYFMQKLLTLCLIFSTFAKPIQALFMAVLARFKVVLNDTEEVRPLGLLLRAHFLYLSLAFLLDRAFEVMQSVIV